MTAHRVHSWQDADAVFRPCPPERIVLCIDASEDRPRFPSQQGGKQHSSSILAVLKKCAEAFILNKAAMNPDHQFALAVLKGNNVLSTNFTNKSAELLRNLHSITPAVPPDQPTQLSRIFQYVYVNFADADDTEENLPVPLRLVILYGRSGTCVMNENILAKFSNVTTDILFVHRPFMSAKEKKRITANFMELQTCITGKAFCAAALSDSAVALEYMMKFLAHPNLR